MKIGMSCMSFDIENAIKTCIDLKLNHIEVGIDDLADWQHIQRVKNQIDEYNISIGIHLPMELNSCELTKCINEKWQEFIYENYLAAKQLNIDYFNMHLGYGIKNKVEKNREQYLDMALYFFYNVLNKITDVNIYIENTYSKNGDFLNLGNKSYDFKYIFDIINKNNFGFCFDSGHFLINKDCYIKDINRIELMHLSDNNLKDDLHLGINKNSNFNSHMINLILKNKNIKYLVLEMKNEYLKMSKEFLDSALHFRV